MKRGDIVLVRFPFTDLSSSKLRPAVVIAPENSCGDVILAFVSSVIRDTQDTDFVLSESDKDFSKSGLKKTSVFKMGKIATLSKDAVYGRMGSVSPRLQKILDEKLRRALWLRDLSK